MTVAELPHGVLVIQDGATPLDRMLDGVYKHVTGQRLRQELYCASLHGAHRDRHITVTRVEDDRHVSPVRHDALLQFEPIEVGKTQVEYQAAWGNDSWAAQKFLR